MDLWFILYELAEATVIALDLLEELEIGNVLFRLEMLFQNWFFDFGFFSFAALDVFKVPDLEDNLKIYFKQSYRTELAHCVGLNFLVVHDLGHGGHGRGSLISSRLLSW